MRLLELFFPSTKERTFFHSAQKSILRFYYKFLIFFLTNSYVYLNGKIRRKIP
jgi:hypothetical protein